MEKTNLPANVDAILERIGNDLTSLRDILTSSTGAKLDDVSPPVLKAKYTVVEAEREKDRIEAAYLAGAYSWDKKRGQKMLVTKRTIGWSPV